MSDSWRHPTGRVPLFLPLRAKPAIDSWTTLDLKIADEFSKLDSYNGNVPAREANNRIDRPHLLPYAKILPASVGHRQDYCYQLRLI